MLTHTNATAAASHKRHSTWQNTGCRFQIMQRTGLCKCLLRKTMPSSWNSECRPLNFIIKGKLHWCYTLIWPLRMSSDCCGLVIIDTKMAAWRLNHVDYYQTGRKDAIKGHCGKCRIRHIWSFPILGTKTQDISTSAALILTVLCFICLLWCSKLYGRSILKHRSTPLSKFLVMWRENGSYQSILLNNLSEECRYSAFIWCPVTVIENINM